MSLEEEIKKLRKSIEENTEATLSTKEIKKKISSIRKEVDKEITKEVEKKEKKEKKEKIEEVEQNINAYLLEIRESAKNLMSKGIDREKIVNIIHKVKPNSQVSELNEKELLKVKKELEKLTKLLKTELEI